MREEIEELIFHMADVKEAIKTAKHPYPLKRAYAGHKAHLRKLFKIRDELVKIQAANTTTSHRSLPPPPSLQTQPQTQDPELVPD